MHVVQIAPIVLFFLRKRKFKNRRYKHLKNTVCMELVFLNLLDKQRSVVITMQKKFIFQLFEHFRKLETFSMWVFSVLN